MISMPPSERDLHAYVDHQLSDADRRLVETFLASNAQVSARYAPGSRMPNNCARPLAAPCSNRPTRNLTRH